ncbi:hypothetical protein INQ23_27265, partial [Escherichia coli]|nr:hypothetical protein [Escherichia coli]
LAIVDYKTGQPPSTRAVRAGFSLQLGLLGLIAERGGFRDVEGTARAFEYWSLARSPRTGGFGDVDELLGRDRLLLLRIDGAVDIAEAVRA